jgi:hypothetical protein
VQRLQKRIEHWRRTREKRSPMPEPLWHAAVQLAQRDSVYSVSRALQVNYQSLQARLAMASAATKSHPAPGAPKGFVELSPTLPMPAAPHTESVVELSDDEGAKLLIRLPAGSDLDVGRLAEAFWSRRR